MNRLLDQTFLEIGFRKTGLGIQMNSLEKKVLKDFRLEGRLLA
jgi:hypothetical protein